VEKHVTNTATPNTDGSRRSARILDGQGPIALIGLTAIAVILAINLLSRSHLAPTDPRLLDSPNCTHCGTVVAVRRSAHSVPVYYIEVKLADGSTLTVREIATGLSVGDVVEVRGTALTPRDLF
jgi:hypothetical protein